MIAKAKKILPLLLPRIEPASFRCHESDALSAELSRPQIIFRYEVTGIMNSRDPLPVFFAEGLCEQFWRGQGCPLFDDVNPAFPLTTTASLQGFLKDGFGEAFVACDMPEPCKFLSLDSCQRFLWTHEEIDLAPHPVVGLVLQVRVSYSCLECYVDWFLEPTHSFQSS